MVTQSSVTRRSLLKTGVVLGSVPISGCAYIDAFSRNSPESLSVSVFNHTSEAHRFGVMMKDGDSTVYDEVFRVGPEDSETRETELTRVQYQVLVKVDRELELTETWHWGGCRVDRVMVRYVSPTVGAVESANLCE